MLSTSCIRPCPTAIAELDTVPAMLLLATGRTPTKLHLRQVGRCEYVVVGVSGARLIIDACGRAWHSVALRLGDVGDIAVHVDFDEGEDSDGTAVSFVTLCARDEEDPDGAGLAERAAREWLAGHLPGFLT